MKPGWKCDKLGGVCTFLNRGISPKYIESGGVCVLNQKCIRDHKINLDLSRRHDDLEKKVPNERFIQIGDVLVNSTGTGTLGRVAQLRDIPLEKITIDSHVTIVRPYSEKFYNDFFGYMMIFIEEEIKKAGEGCGGQTELSRFKLSETFYVQYPESISEQKRIVAILDDAFDRIDTAIANTEKNIANAKELFKIYCSNVLNDKNQDCKALTIGDICYNVEYGTAKKSSHIGEIPVIRMGNIQNRRIDWSNMAYTSDKDDIKKLILKYNDILFNRTNSAELVGKTGIYKGEHPAIFAGYLVRINIKKDIVDADFLNYYLNSEIARDYGKHVMTCSVNQANINGSKLKNYPIKLPALDIQKQIAHNFGEIANYCDSIHAYYENKIEQLHGLKQSLLQKAFSGELTTDFNPEALEI